jgi:hypothetical protein
MARPPIESEFGVDSRMVSGNGRHASKQSGSHEHILAPSLFGSISLLAMVALPWNLCRSDGMRGFSARFWYRPHMIDV